MNYNKLFTWQNIDGLYITNKRRNKMDKKQAAWNEMSKIKYQLDDKLGELEKAQDNYRDELVQETIQTLATILKDEGTLSERDFNLLIGSLARDIKNIYNR